MQRIDDGSYGKCTNCSREIPPERLEKGDFLAREGERGILPEVVKPGKHYINPYAYDTSEEKAIEIHHNEVGVKTLLWGQDPRQLQLALKVTF